MGLSPYRMLMTGTSKDHIFQFKKQVVQCAQAPGLSLLSKNGDSNPILKWIFQIMERINQAPPDSPFFQFGDKSIDLIERILMCDEKI